MKTNKETLILLLKNIDSLRTGLCSLGNILEMRNVITFPENDNIHTYISSHKPTKRSKIYGSGPDIFNDSYYWTIKDKESRVRWLKYHIRICKS